MGAFLSIQDRIEWNTAPYMKGIKMNQKQIEKEWKRLIKLEEKFINHNVEKKEKEWQNKLEKFVPEKLSGTLNTAFYKAFELIFEKGTGLIEKTYNKEKREQDYKINEYAAELKNNRKTMKVFGKQAKASQNLNMAISAVEGIGMGAAGAGLPDIPVFLGVLLKSIYEIALIYGFTYDTEQEQIFILKMIETALACEDELLESNAELNKWIEAPQLFEISKTEQIKRTSEVLANEMLYLKFVQGIPVVGIAGGLSDVVYQKKITDYAQLKYKRRFYKRNMERQNCRK